MVLFFACVGIVFYCAGCISFRIQPPYPEEAYIESISFCLGIQETEDELLAPVDIKEEFSMDDDNIVCFVAVKNIGRKIQLRWKWYAPNKDLSRDSENIVINSSASPLETLFAYDEIQLSLREKDALVGVWTVVVLLDNQVLARKVFEVR